jgi:hypothetical protein
MAISPLVIKTLTSSIAAEHRHRTFSAQRAERPLTPTSGHAPGAPIYAGRLTVRKAWYSCGYVFQNANSGHSETVP